MNGKKLSILLQKNGFSFCVVQDREIIHDEFVAFSETDLHSGHLAQYFSSGLYLQQNYAEVKISVLTPDFSIVPKEFMDADKDPQKWLEFSAEIFQDDRIETSELNNIDAELIYSYSEDISHILNEKFGHSQIESASAIFINSIVSEDEKAVFFVNLHHGCIEIMLRMDGKLLFYNIFETETREDAVYYILNAYKQLGLDPNKTELYYFGGNLGEESMKMLMNFVRHVIPGTSDLNKMNYYTEMQHLT